MVKFGYGLKPALEKVGELCNTPLTLRGLVDLKELLNDEMGWRRTCKVSLRKSALTLCTSGGETLTLTGLCKFIWLVGGREKIETLRRMEEDFYSNAWTPRDRTRTDQERLLYLAANVSWALYGGLLLFYRDIRGPVAASYESMEWFVRDAHTLFDVKTGTQHHWAH